MARGLASPGELAAGRALGPAKPTERPLAVGAVASVLAEGTSYERAQVSPARFSLGEDVRARNAHPEGHTRLPRYVRGRRGRIDKVHGVFVLPDANAHGLGETPQWLYSVRFSGGGALGRRRRASADVSVDAWESYLEEGKE